MRIGIDFDNTIICYDDVFCDLAKSWQLISDSNKTKREVRDAIQALPEGDLVWQRLQGKAYGELIHKASLFHGFKEFITECNRDSRVELFIVSHKTEWGHFDENRMSLRTAAREWLRSQGFFTENTPYIRENNVFFETTREEKIARIKALNCTHFIDDLVEVLDSPLFPKNIQRYLFQPQTDEPDSEIKSYSSWIELKNAIFSR